MNLYKVELSDRTTYIVAESYGVEKIDGKIYFYFEENKERIGVFLINQLIGFGKIAEGLKDSTVLKLIKSQNRCCGSEGLDIDVENDNHEG